MNEIDSKSEENYFKCNIHRKEISQVLSFPPPTPFNRLNTQILVILINLNVFVLISFTTGFFFKAFKTILFVVLVPSPSRDQVGLKLWGSIDIIASVFFIPVITPVVPLAHTQLRGLCFLEAMFLRN